MSPSRREFLAQAATFSAWQLSGLACLGCREPVDSPATFEFGKYDGLGLADLVRTRQVAPWELVEAVIHHTRRINPQLNAVVEGLLDPQAARARAKSSLGNGLLHGVPVMLKNLVEYRGARIDFGSRLHALAIQRNVAPAAETSPLVDAMERSGMIITGITNSAELGLIDTTEPILHGPTRNPWNTKYTAGGSSGGSAAVVAAGIVPLAHGNDGAGSIRIPASHCGVFGLKPSRGRERGSGTASGVLNISSDLCLSRSVRDTAAFLSEIEKREDADLPPVGFVRGPAAKRLKIALVVESASGVAPHPEVDRGVRSAAALCRDLGHEVDEVALPIAGLEFTDAFIGLWATTALGFEEMVVQWLGEGTKPADVLEPWTIGLIALAKKRGREASLLQAVDVFTRVGTQMEAFFHDYDVMLSPVLRVPPFLIGHHDPAGDFDTIMERVLDAVAYTPLQNAAGMPGMSVPLHWTADGLPVGVQFSAWRGAEAMLLALAYELETARPWFDRRPPVTVR